MRSILAVKEQQPPWLFFSYITDTSVVLRIVHPSSSIRNVGQYLLVAGHKQKSELEGVKASHRKDSSSVGTGPGIIIIAQNLSAEVSAAS